MLFGAGETKFHVNSIEFEIQTPTLEENAEKKLGAKAFKIKPWLCSDLLSYIKNTQQTFNSVFGFRSLPFLLFSLFPLNIFNLNADSRRTVFM